MYSPSRRPGYEDGIGLRVLPRPEEYIKNSRPKVAYTYVTSLCIVDDMPSVTQIGVKVDRRR